MMSQYREQFGEARRVFPVIHVTSFEQALRNVAIACDEGADGAFLITHGEIPDRALLEIHSKIHAKFEGWFIGVNCLTVSPLHLFAMLSEDVTGVWIDNAAIDEEKEDQADAELIKKARRESAWEGLYFGGVAFKYQREVEPTRLGDAAKIASRYLDVITTSGPGTGRAAAVEKIATMKQALGEFPLAIASGITPDNITDFLPHADCFLVATGISSRFDELNKNKLRALIEAVNKYNASDEERDAPVGAERHENGDNVRSPQNAE